MTDFFDSLLTLEEDFYSEGYTEGTADGAEAGRIEGRVFGLEKGFEKFIVLGQLQGRCNVWAARTAPDAPAAITNPRAVKNIEAASLMLMNPPFKNEDDAVEEVDKTLKKAKAKVKILERTLGERSEGGGPGKGVDGEADELENAGRNAPALLRS